MPISTLVRRLSRAPQPQIPAEQRVYAVGDIHGRLDLLEELIGRIEEDEAERPSADTTLIFLGDLVNRGPDSCGVVERLLRLSRERPGTRFLKGNHEQVLLRAVTGDPKAVRFLVRIGGRATLLSYGIPEAEYDQLDYVELTERFAALVPQDHVEFLAGFDDWLAIGDYLFVHAGLRPGVAVEDQSPEDLRWIRSEFLDHRSSFGKIVVHGHSISEEVEIRPNRIGIDTGAYASGRLSAVGLEGSERWFLST
jgi:serine/threonine protein phosphatase 1